MSSEWPTVTIEDVCDLIVDCVNKTAPVVVHKTPFRMIRTTNVRHGRIDLSECRYVEEDIYEKWTRRASLQQGDVVLTREAPIGEVGMVKEAEGVFLGQRLMQYRANPKLLDSRFLLYTFLSPALQHQFGSHEGSGSVVSHIRVGDCFKFKLSLPPIGTQREIASTLGALDDRITLLRETNATLEAIAQALFKSWFVDFDPVRAKMAGCALEGMDEATAALFPDALEETELGVVPQGWQIGVLGSLAVLNPENWSAKNHPDRILYVDLANTKANQIEGITEFRFDDAPSRARRVLREGDVIVGTVRPGNRSFARISVDRAGLTGSTGFAVLRAHHPFDQALVYIAATREESIERLAHLADGGAYPAVRPEVVAGTPVVIAPRKVREAFGDVANHLLAQIGSNQEQSRYLDDIRDTLLPRLISGQLRLPEAQAFATELTAH